MTTLCCVGAIENNDQGSARQSRNTFATGGNLAVGHHYASPLLLLFAQFEVRKWCTGVYKEPSCMWKAEELDHAVTLMGYGTSDQGEDYWLIKWVCCCARHFCACEQ